ncbi:RNA-binding protein 4B-like [Boleophthalmus pectinirostris]|uniref:RNA-binding protein 4B-like n=1 Tax=Boleophthalmus pectinirostris TaxID=150288 RepID=UPI000A1C60E2|nr:RNA-binding protein 4B-like [Boleophthalmus pectinirostris]
MVKIFIGNLAQETEKEELEALFAPYGTVTECAKFKNYAFIHMDDRKAATKAIRELHFHKLNGRPINVEPSRAKNQGPMKLHVANVEKGHEKELQELFEEYGTVSECAIVKNFAFVHMPNADEAMDALEGLDNSEFQGKRINVQVSKSRPRGAPEEDYYPPPSGRGSYYPPRYPDDRHEPYRGPMSAYGAPPPMPPPPPRRGAYPDRYGDNYAGMVDYYEKYRARGYSTPYNDRRSSAIPPPPPPSSALAQRLGLDPYDRRPMPPPPSYIGRDRSPLRRAPPPPPPAGNGFSYERSRLSPVSKGSSYGVPRSRDMYSERLPPPPPARYAY